MGFTHPVYVEPYHTMQFIDNERILKAKGVSDQVLSVFVPSIHFFLEYFFFLTVGLLIRVYLLKLRLGKDRNQPNFFGLISTNLAEKIAFKKINFFSVFFLFFVIYGFFLKQFLGNNIKTNKVVSLSN